MNTVSANKPPIQVALVEDDPEIRANLAHRVGRSPGFRLLRSYSDAESALADLPRHPPDVVLMDINLPGIDGVEASRRLRIDHPAVAVILLSSYDEAEFADLTGDCGAAAYVPKSMFGPDRLEVLWRAISRSRSG